MHPVAGVDGLGGLGLVAPVALHDEVALGEELAHGANR